MSKSGNWHRDTAIICSGITRSKNIKHHPAASSLFFPGERSHPQCELASRQTSESVVLVAFEVKGGRTDAFQFLNALKLKGISNNLGSSESLACHLSSTTHTNSSKDERQILEMNKGRIRLSVGLEYVADLTADKQQALYVCRGN
tara:strand:+ start:240 stop:674 length:435 start_codon:yes stop_codon:yes gene_type:complete